MKFRQALPWMGWTLVGLIVAFSLGYWYLSAQRLRVDDENRRELAHVAHDLKSILTELSSSAKQYFRNPPDSPAEFVREFVRRSPYLDHHSELPEDISLKASACPVLDTPQSLQLDSLKLNVNTEAIIGDVAISDAFEYILIADSEGKVMFAMEHGVESHHRNGLGWLDRHARERSEANHSSIGVENLTGLLTPDGKAEKPLATAPLAQASALHDVKIGDTDYQLLTYPISIAMPQGCAGDTKTWIVGALVDPIRMWHEAATISPRATLVLFLALVLCLAAEPFVKLYFLRPTERFRFADACMLLPNASILLMGVSVLLLEWGTHARLESAADGGLELLAANVDKNLTTELRHMRNQLVAFDQQFAGRQNPCAFPLETEDPTEILNPESEPLIGPADEYKDFSQVSWIDPEGKQIYKATVHPQKTTRLKLATRTYFEAPRFRPGSLWNFAGDPGGQPFFVESLRLMTTAELSTGVSIVSKLNKSCDKPYVAMISGQLLATEVPLLPAGYEFAVIAGDGQVLYHSDRRRPLKEDFFGEITDPEFVHAAIQGASSLHLDTTYSGRPTRMFVTRMTGVEGANWFLVTSRDRGWLDSVSTEALVRTLVWCLCSWLVLLGVGLGFLFAGIKTLSFWWPSPEKKGLYRALTLTYIGMLTGGLVLVATLPATGRALFLLSMSFPLLLAVATTIVHVAWSRRPHATQRVWKSYRTPWYIAAIAGMWAAASLTPAVGLFRQSWRIEIEKLQRFEGMRKARYENDWRAEDRTHYAEAAKVEANFFAGRAGRRPSYPLPFAKASAGPGWDQWLDRYLPFYSEPVESLRLQEPTPANGETSAGFGYEFAGISLNAFSISGFALLVVGSGLWLRFHFRNLFWTHLNLTAAAPPVFASERRFALLLAPSSQEKEHLAGLFRRDVAAAVAAGGGSSTVAAPELVDFEPGALSDEALERISRADADKRVVILAASAPNGETPAEEQERWLHALERVVQTVAPVNGARLESLWRQCTKHERLTLIHVAQEGFANPRSTTAVQSLLGKGLLIRDPQLKVMNADFEDFVLRHAQSPEMKKLEHPEHGLGWRGVRWILLAVLLLGLVFLAGTGESWIKSAATMTTALAAGLETIWKLRSSVQKVISASSGD